MCRLPFRISVGNCEGHRQGWQAAQPKMAPRETPAPDAPIGFSCPLSRSGEIHQLSTVARFPATLQESIYALLQNGLVSCFPRVAYRRCRHARPAVQYRLCPGPGPAGRQELHRPHAQVHNRPCLYLAAGGLLARVQDGAHSGQAAGRCGRRTRYAALRRGRVQVLPHA